MSGGRGELIATNESTIVAEPLLDAVVVQDGQRDGCLSDSAGTNESDWSQIFCQASDLLDKLVASEEGPRWRGRGFPRYARFKCEKLSL